MMAMEKRVYQAWKGSNKFLFSGRLIFGPDVRSLVVSIFLIVVPVVIFCIFVARNLFHSFAVYNSGYAVLIVAVVLTIYVLTLLLLTSGRDPGIIPRNPHPPEPEECDESTGTSPAEWGGGRTPRYRLPRTKDVTVNGITVKVKYCDTCMLYRPPRCSHCSICNNCVERFDHHCPWVGQCIGQRNYRFFFMFVSSATLLCIYVFSFSAVYINFLMKGDAQSPANRTALQAIGKSPASIVLMVYSFIAVWFVGGLTIFHLYLISTNQDCSAGACERNWSAYSLIHTKIRNRLSTAQLERLVFCRANLRLFRNFSSLAGPKQTTYENFRYRYDNRVNAFNRGVVKNFGEIFCSRIEPSKNDFRAKVQVDTSGRIITNPQPILGLGKQGGDLEVGDKLTWQGETTEVDDEVRGRISEGGDLALEMKQRYDDALARAVGHSLHVEGSEMGNQPRPSWSRKSGNWDTGSDALSVDPGRRNADKSPGRERVHWK